MSRYSNLLKDATGYTQAFGAADITTQDMKKAIATWFELYYHGEATKKEDPCQRIAYTIVRKLTKTVFSEYEATSDNEFAKKLLAELAKVCDKAMQMALIGGEALLKPVVLPDGGVVFGVVPRNNILVFGRDSHGALTDIGAMERSTAGNRYYTLLERRTVDEKGFLTIRYKLFQSFNEGNLGQQVPLATLPQYVQLQEEYTFQSPVGSIGLVPLKTPMANCVDGSADSVSVYAAAVGLIRNIDKNEALINGEFDRGQSRVIVSSDMLQRDAQGNAELSNNLFVGLDEDPETTGITIFTPQLREQSFLARKQEYLRNVENVIGLKRGLLSEVETAERTATEITSSAGEYNLTVIDFQRKWEETLRETMRVCAVLFKLYNVAGAQEIPEDAVTIDWGNGILYDETKTWEDYKSMVAAGLIKPEIALGWRFNMPTDTESELAKIRAKYMPDALEEE